METYIIKALIIYGLANCDSDAKLSTIRRAAGQSTDNTKTTSKQATSNTQTGQLMDDEGVGVSECKGAEITSTKLPTNILYKRTICK